MLRATLKLELGANAHRPRSVHDIIINDIPDEISLENTPDRFHEILCFEITKWCERQGMKPENIDIWDVYDVDLFDLLADPECGFTD